MDRNSTEVASWGSNDFAHYKKSQTFEPLHNDSKLFGAASHHECHKCLTTYSYVWRRNGDEETEICNACFLEFDRLSCPFCANKSATEQDLMECCFRCHRLYHRSCEILYRTEAQPGRICIVCEVADILKRGQYHLRTSKQLIPILNHHIFHFTNYFKFPAKGNPTAPAKSDKVSRHRVRSEEQNKLRYAELRSGYSIVSGRASSCKVDCWRYPDLIRASSQCLRTFSTSKSACKNHSALNMCSKNSNGGIDPLELGSHRVKFNSSMVAAQRDGFSTSRVLRIPSDHKSYIHAYRHGTQISPACGTASSKETNRRQDAFPSKQGFPERQTYAKILKIIDQDMENMGKDILEIIAANIESPAQEFAGLICKRNYGKDGGTASGSNDSALEECFDSYKVPLGIIAVACVNLFFKIDKDKYRRLPRAQALLVVMNSFGVYPALINTASMVRTVQNSLLKPVEHKNSPEEAFFRDLCFILSETAKLVFQKLRRLSADEKVAHLLQRMELDNEEKLGSFLSQFLSEHAVAQLERESRERGQWLAEFESAGRSASPL